MRSIFITGSLMLLTVGALFAVGLLDLFELGDGLGTPGSADIIGDGNPANGPDWADLFNADGSLKDSNSNGIPDVKEVYGGVDALFLLDDLAQGKLKDDTVFAESNKNNDLTATWNWDTGNVPPKDDLANVYAYATLNEFDELIIYAGLERLAPEGDSHIDFQFSQQPIGLDKSPPCGDDHTDDTPEEDDTAPCEFTGEKTVNDLLVVMDFEKGGKLGFVEVRRWNGLEYILIETLGGEGCSAADTVCAFNNGSTIFGGDWVNYDRHGKEIVDLPPNSFTEIGINVTQLMGTTPCFSTILAKSRSSQSFNSELKDFTFGTFEICGIEVTKDGPELSKIGDEVTYTYTIENTGVATLYLVSVDDDKVGDLTSDAASEGCDVLDAGEICTFDVDFVIPPGADDPFDNEVTVIYNSASDQSGSEISDKDDHSINLFQPDVEITKDGDTLSKIGDEVTYSFMIMNTSSDDSPDLILDSIDDDVLGDLMTEATENGCDTLAPGASCSFDVDYTIQEGDNDPLTNTVEVHYHPDGFPNDITDTDNHTVELFQPSVDVNKTGDALSKVGDTVTYYFTITNTGSDDSPDLVLASVTDTLLGDLTTLATSNGCDTLGYGESCNFSKDHVVPGGSDPLVNTVSALYHPDGFPNDIEDQDSHSVNLFQPRVQVIKTGDTLSKEGDTVTYNFTINNTSSMDSPNLLLDSVGDTVIGDLTATANSNGCGSLAPSGSCNFSVNRTVVGTDPDPLVNVVTVHFHPDGFPNDVSHTDDHSVDLVHPELTVTKMCGPDQVVVGQDVTYTVTIDNPGDVTLNKISIDDSVVGSLTDGTNPAIDSNSCGNSIAALGSCTIVYHYTVQSGDPNPLVNEVTATYQVDGLPNQLTRMDECSVEITFPEGCTPGFWKNHEELWDGVGMDDVTTIIKTFLSFNGVFGVNNSYSGLGNSVTLLQALDVSGSELMALNRHASAGLVNADSGAGYPYSTAQVIALYRDAVGIDPGPETIGSAHLKLRNANEQDCPFD